MRKEVGRGLIGGESLHKLWEQGRRALLVQTWGVWALWGAASG